MLFVFNRREEMKDAITSVELFVVWMISIVVFGSVGYFSIELAYKFADVLFPLVKDML